MESTRMEKQRHKALLIVLFLVGLTYWNCATMKAVSLSDDPAVAASLPDRVGDYEGLVAYYCQSNACRGCVTTDQAPESQSCPDCGGGVGIWSPAERQSLPADTTITKRRYLRAGEPAIHVAIVISGRDRLSLHRPQNCLPGQGFIITAARDMPVPEGDFVLRWLDLEWRAPGSAPGARVSESSYLYVYLAGSRQTSSQLEMMLWMAWDRLVHNRADRWAYFSIASERTSGNRKVDEARLMAFATELIPHVRAGGE